MEAGKIVRTQRVRLEDVGPPIAGAWEAVLEHERLPFVSYPYEWPFGMLKDAALLQLELLTAALEEDMVLKDATSYNVQWIGSRPIFIDVPSFVALEEGQPWAGYRQFCELCLYPLLLTAYKDVAYHPWLRGRIDGILSEEIGRLLSFRDLFRPGVLMHVKLQAAMQARHADDEKDLRKELKSAGFHKELIQVNARRLSKLVRGLAWGRSRSAWSGYASDNSYDEADRARKVEFVHRATVDRHRRLVWDLGCNTGDYSRVAARDADYVLSMDGDHVAVEALYQDLKAEGSERILPLVVDLADPSPGLGWGGVERKPLLERGRPDLVLALALIHHLAIAANVPLTQIVDSFAAYGADLVVEFVTKDDPMVKKLLRNKADIYEDYELNVFERTLARSFDVLAREELKDGLRVLYFARPRAGSVDAPLAAAGTVSDPVPG